MQPPDRNWPGRKRKGGGRKEKGKELVLSAGAAVGGRGGGGGRESDCGGKISRTAKISSARIRRCQGKNSHRVFSVARRASSRSTQFSTSPNFSLSPAVLLTRQFLEARSTRSFHIHSCSSRCRPFAHRPHQPMTSEEPTTRYYGVDIGAQKSIVVADDGDIVRTSTGKFCNKRYAWGARKEGWKEKSLQMHAPSWHGGRLFVPDLARN